MYSTCTSKEKSFWVGEISPSQCDNYGYKLFMKAIIVELALFLYFYSNYINYTCTFKMISPSTGGG
jgi:hypothetical protein